jgi:hypothetical protein
MRKRIKTTFDITFFYWQKGVLLQHKSKFAVSGESLKPKRDYRYAKRGQLKRLSLADVSERTETLHIMPRASRTVVPRLVVPARFPES